MLKMCHDQMILLCSI